MLDEIKDNEKAEMSGVQIMKIAIALFSDSENELECKYISIYHLLVHLNSEGAINPNDFNNFTYNELDFIKKATEYEKDRMATIENKAKAK